ncbi:hypothetical protein B9Z41_17010 [Limnohabitans sp. JirII-31]|nr:hypothetical protein B9Z41_17010 [Limnohabitans sp. JirII-31]
MYRHVAVVESCDRFAEGDGHQAGVADLERAVGEADAGRGGQGVDGVVGADGVAAAVACHIGVARCERDHVAGGFEVGCGREGARPGNAAIGAAHGAQAAVLHRHVAVVETCDGFAEDDGDHAGLTDL